MFELLGTLFFKVVLGIPMVLLLALGYVIKFMFVHPGWSMIILGMTYVLTRRFNISTILRKIPFSIIKRGKSKSLKNEEDLFY